jgi:hypothetical protein
MGQNGTLRSDHRKDVEREPRAGFPDWNTVCPASLSMAVVPGAPLMISTLRTSYCGTGAMSDTSLVAFGVGGPWRVASEREPLRSEARQVWRGHPNKRHTSKHEKLHFARYYSRWVDGRMCVCV